METKEAISIKAPNFQVAAFRIRGTAPLVLHRFSKKAEIMAKQAEGSKANIKKVRAARDFDKDYREAMYLSKEGWHGIPATSFRNAMIAACRVVGYKMTHARMAVFVEADGMDKDGTPLVKIATGEPQRHEGYARNQTGVIDIRVRPMWQEWSADLRVKFDADMMSLTDVANLLQRAGIQSGIGEGRPNGKESGGCGWGTFELASGGRMSTRELTKLRLLELEKIQRDNGGVLNPGEVVEFACDPNSALHGYFQWDDTIAAQQFRLAQARAIIRVLVTVENIGGADRKIRAFVSIAEDRKKGGGYRSTVEVMADEELRDKLLSTALVELKGFKRRYAELTELAHVFESIDETISVLEPRREERRATA